MNCLCGCGQDAGVYARTNGADKKGAPRRFIPGHQRDHARRVRWGSKTVDQRFWEKVNKNGPFPKDESLGQCWLWTGGTDTKGYGRFQVNSGTEFEHEMGAHRYAYVQAHGLLMSSRPTVLHKCDTPLCVRSSHLVAGTQADNVRDMDAKGRRGVNIGPANEARRKYDKLPFDVIRDRFLAGEGPREIAVDFDCSRDVIRRLLLSHGIPSRKSGPRQGSKQSDAARMRKSESLKRAWREGRRVRAVIAVDQ